MIKIIILLGLVAFSYQLYDCQDLNFEDCNNDHRCFWEEENQVCLLATYYPLEHHRESIPHSVIFDDDEACSYVLKEGDFVAQQTFKKSKAFRSFCRFYNVLKIKVRGQYYDSADNIPSEKFATSAILYPEARDGCALLYTKKFFRGKSWEVCKATRLYGSKIRSIMQGRRSQLSLYDYNGHALGEYQQLTFNDEGIPKFRNSEVVEFILIEKYDDN